MFKETLKSSLKSFGLLRSARELRATLQARTWSKEDSKKKLFYSQFLKQNSLCFDVGANRGNRTKVFLSLGSKVIGIEPQPHCVKFLQKNFGNNKNFIIEATALGETEGVGKIFLSEVDTLSTLSPDWVQKQKKSGRFRDINWSGEVDVKVTTLNKLVEKYGEPDFIKIDVEGFELNVIKGLSERFSSLSIEFSPEFYDSIIESLELLNTRYSVIFNFSAYESMEMINPEWMHFEGIKSHLLRYKDSTEYFGDVYVKVKQ